jgi:hypothetical protein
MAFLHMMSRRCSSERISSSPPPLEGRPNGASSHCATRDRRVGELSGEAQAKRDQEARARQVLAEKEVAELRRRAGPRRLEPRDAHSRARGRPVRPIRMVERRGPSLGRYAPSNPGGTFSSTVRPDESGVIRGRTRRASLTLTGHQALIFLILLSAPRALMATFTASSIGSLNGTSIRSRPFS